MSSSQSNAAAEQVAEPKPLPSLQPPKNLLDFMVQGWKAPDASMPSPIDGYQFFQQRRASLSTAFPGEVLVIPTGREKVRANDTTYRFRPSSDFYYYSGNVEPDCVLVLIPRDSASGHDAVLYAEPNPGKSDSTFFTDRSKGELWVGPRMGLDKSRARFAVDDCRAVSSLAEQLAAFASAGKPIRVLRGVDEEVDKLLPAQVERDNQFATVMSEARLIKDTWELKELKDAVDSTHRGFEDVIRAMKRATSEREVEGVFNLRARVEGNDVGYGTIAACSEHACILHWTHNHGEMKKNQLLLLDAGVEMDSLYTADITRTLPVGGKYSLEQKEIYDLVWESQRQAFAAIRPGVDFLEPNRVAMRVLAHGLQRMGILADAEEALKDENQFYKRYTLHNISHMLGIDVHDCAKARQEVYRFGKLVEGYVLTVEPGLYFQVDDLTVPEKYRGIGVRIEDDVVVTADGCHNLSGDIPSKSEEVEAWMAKIWEPSWEQAPLVRKQAQ